MWTNKFYVYTLKFVVSKIPSLYLINGRGFLNLMHVQLLCICISCYDSTQGYINAIELSVYDLERTRVYTMYAMIFLAHTHSHTHTHTRAVTRCKHEHPLPDCQCLHLCLTIHQQPEVYVLDLRKSPRTNSDPPSSVECCSRRYIHVYI